MTRASENAAGDDQSPRDLRGTRADGRFVDQLRPVSFERDFTVFAPGSVLVTMGRTRVLCTASVEDRVPAWLRGGGKGWVTAEWGISETNRKVRFYRLTPDGRKHLKAELSGYDRVTQAIQDILRTA